MDSLASEMANEFDPYREALVVERQTIWPEEYRDWSTERRDAVAAQLHAAPKEASSLKYVRLHTGFSRQITVTAEDLARLGGPA